MKLLISLSAAYYEVHLTRGGNQSVWVYIPHGPADNQTKYYDEFRDAVNAENRRHHESGRATWVLKNGRALVKKLPKRDAHHLTYQDFRGAYF